MSRQAIVLCLVVLLSGCVKSDRQLVLDTDECLHNNQRAVMHCGHGGHCYIECREKTRD